MDASLNYLKKAKPANGVFGSRGIAAQKLAVDSLQNIANLDFARPKAASDSSGEAAAISNLLATAAQPMAVADIARDLNWDAVKAAQALVRGAESGLLKFTRDGDETKVELSPES